MLDFLGKILKNVRKYMLISPHEIFNIAPRKEIIIHTDNSLKNEDWEKQD